jgi:hypothetical protein
MKAINIDTDAIPRKKRKKPSKFQKFKTWLEFDVWNSITYYCWRNPKRIVYNFIYFFKVVYNYRDFDYSYNFEMFHKSLERTANAIDTKEIIVDHKETADSIREYIRLWKRLQDDDYVEEAGCNWDNVNLRFEPIKDEDLFEMKSDSSYSEEEMNEFYKKAKVLREKDFELMIEAFKKYEQWWD